jgi:heat-inducible transcriptional repressor
MGVRRQIAMAAQQQQHLITELNDRSREIFRKIVDSYVLTGDPVGSRTLSRLISQQLSPATIRNVMADLEEMGLLYAPHASAGRIPTEIGLRLFVDGLLQLGDLSDDDRKRIESNCLATGKTVDAALNDASQMLSGLAQCAGLVAAPKTEASLKHIEFVNLGDGRALVVMVTTDGLVENRVIKMPLGTPPSALVQAGNYLNARLAGRTLDEARADVMREIEAHQAQIDAITEKLVAEGLAVWSGDRAQGSLIIKGQAHLLKDISALGEIDRVRHLFESLETRETLAKLLELANRAEGVQIYIGAETELFNLTGCTLVVAPFSGTRNKIVGAIGVVGPTRINYARIIPIVDYTAKVVSRLVG